MNTWFEEISLTLVIMFCIDGDFTNIRTTNGHNEAIQTLLFEFHTHNRFRWVTNPRYAAQC